MFFSLVSIVSFAAGLYSILVMILATEKQHFGPIAAFGLLIVGWASLWVILFHYRPLLKEEGPSEIMGRYDR